MKNIFYWYYVLVLWVIVADVDGSCTKDDMTFDCEASFIDKPMSISGGVYACANPVFIKLRLIVGLLNLDLPITIYADQSIALPGFKYKQIGVFLTTEITNLHGNYVNVKLKLGASWFIQLWSTTVMDETFKNNYCTSTSVSSTSGDIRLSKNSTNIHPILAFITAMALGVIF